MSNVLGFTPIDPRLLTTIPAEPGPGTVPAVNGANNGKKRQRKVTVPDPKATKAAGPRKSKKAKQAASPASQHATDMFTVTKPDAENRLKELSLEKTRGTIDQQAGVDLFERLRSKGPPLTSKGLPFISTEGLGLSYQAAFRKDEQQPGANRHARLLQSGDVDDRSPRKMFGFSPLGCMSSSATLEAVRAEAKGSASDKEAIRGSISDQTGPAPVCEVPCSPGVMLDLKQPKCTTMAPPAGAVSLADRDTCRWNKNLMTGQRLVPRPLGWLIPYSE